MPLPGRDARGRFTAGAGFTGGDSSASASSAASADLIRALEGATDALRGLDETTSRANKEEEGGSGGIGGLGKFAIGAAIGVAANIAAAQAIGSGGDLATNSFRETARLADYVPGLGKITGQVTNPLDRAEQRVGAITSVIARAGGTVSPELRNALARRFTAEEARVERELEATSAAVNSDRNFDRATEGTVIGSVGKTVNDFLDRLFNGRQR